MAEVMHNIRPNDLGLFHFDFLKKNYCFIYLE